MRLMFACLLLACCAGLSAAPLFYVESAVDTPSPRVQAEVLLKLIFFQGGDVRDVKFRLPAVRLADAEPLGKPVLDEVIRDGQRYRRHQQRVRIRPFASGVLELTGFGVEGRRPGAAQPEFWPAPTVALSVRAAPLGSADWLPARAVRLSEQPVVQAEPAVGQPWLRTLVIEAEGVDPASLPELTMTVAGATVIARPPLTIPLDERRSKFRHEQRFEILPQRAGSLELSPIQLHWWDVVYDLPAVTRLPGRVIEVSGAPLPADQVFGWPAWSAWLLVTGFLIVWLTHTRRSWRVLFALIGGKPQRMRDALLDWARYRWLQDPPVSLIDLARRLGCEDEGLRALDRCCYGAGERVPRLSRLGWRLLVTRRKAA